MPFLFLLLVLTLVGTPIPLNLPALAVWPEIPVEEPDAESVEPEAGLGRDLPIASKDDVARKIEAILGKPRHRSAFWGVDVYSVEDGEIIYAYNSDQNFSPASNVKVFTTAAALDRFGPEFRFKTRLTSEGWIGDDGIFRGDLALIGEGDPNLAGNLTEGRNPYVFLDSMAQKVREAGIRGIEGDVVGDDSYFPYAPYGRGWIPSDLTQYYGAPVSALSFQDNLIRVVMRPGAKVGQPVRVYFDPQNTALKLVNLAKTVGAEQSSSAYCYRPSGTNRVVVSGVLSSSSRGLVRYVTVDDPALYTANLFLHRLKKAGVKVKGTARSRHFGDTVPARPRRELYVHVSPPLIEIISHVNKESRNLDAEILLRTLGAEVKGLGTDAAGLEVLYAFLKEAGIAPSMVDLRDGSGLSRDNLITPRAETLLLQYVAKQPYFPVFLESLSVAGKDGTLRNRMRRTAADLRVYGKTGSLQNVTTLGGYIKTRSHRTLAFSILINNCQFSAFTARRAMDQICTVLAQY